MNQLLRRLGYEALAKSPVRYWFDWRSRRRLEVLAYHDVASAANFEAQMDFLAAERTLLSADQLLACVRGRTWPERATFITFDDGDPSVAEVAMPILAVREIPAAVFVITDLVDTERCFWWDEVELNYRAGEEILGEQFESPPAAVRWLKAAPDARRREWLAALREAKGTPRGRQLSFDDLRALAKHGIEIGNHTASHPCLDRCEPAVVEREILSAHDRLAAELGAHPRLFAFPNGNLAAPARKVLRDLGYELAFGFDHRLDRCPPGDLLAVSRIRVNSAMPMSEFKAVTSGLHSALMAIRTAGGPRRGGGVRY